MQAVFLALIVVLTVVLAACNLPYAEAAQADNTDSAIVGETIQLQPGVPLNTSLHASLPAGVGIQEGILRVYTPPTGDAAAGGVSISENNSSIWRWPASLGESTTFTNGSTLDAKSDNKSANVELPFGSNVTGGTVKVLAPNGTLTGNYSLEVRTAQEAILSFEGSQVFLPPEPDISTAVSSLITSVSVAEQPNGTLLVAEGTSVGALYLLDFVPGGQLLYERVIDLGYSSEVTATLAQTFAYSPYSATVVAASGPLIFIFNQTSKGSWTEETLKTAENLSAAPIVTGLASTVYPSGFPAILIATNEGTIDVSNFSNYGAAGGWESPIDRLADLGSRCSSVLALQSGPNGSSTIAAGCNSAVSVYDLETSGMFLIGSLSLPPSQYVDSLTFNSTGSSLVIGSSSGELYSSVAPWVAPPVARTSTSSEPLVGLAAISADGVESVIAETDNCTVYLIPDFWSTSTVRTMASLGIAVTPGTLGLGGLLGAESDLYFAAGTDLEVARSVSQFSSTTIGSAWVSGISEASNSTSPTTDAYGNSIVNVPIYLIVQGGEVEVTDPIVDYNFTWAINIPEGSIISSLSKSSQGSYNLNYPLRVLASSGGALHFELVISYSTPSAQSAASEIWNALQGGVVRYGLYITLGIALAGASLFVLGQLGYLHRTHNKNGLTSQPSNAPRGD